MPTYEYQCAHCGVTYDVFHKVREIREDVVCPSCGSAEHKKLMSAPGVSIAGSAGEVSCATGDCCGGTCGVN